MYARPNRTRERKGAGMRLCCLILVATAALVSPAPGAPEPRAVLGDEAITTAIETRLKLDEGVSGHLLDVHTRDGLVTLSGIADHLLAQDRAVALAKSVKGVRAVLDQTAVNPVRRSDAEIRADLARVFEQDPLVPEEDIEMTVADAQVTLKGSVPSWFQKELVARRAKGVVGIEVIENEVTYEYTQRRADEEIERDIAHRFEWSPWIREEGVDIRVTDGRVTVAGTVGSADQKHRVYAAAWVPGVADVDTSALEVEPAMARPIRKKGYCQDVSSDEIRRAIERTFALDTRLSSHNPTVTVEDSVVTLQGVVQDLEASRAAERDASNTVCVRRVRNHLKVRPRVMDSDAVLVEHVEAALARNPYLKGLDIAVSVGNSRVKLGGGVDTLWQKEIASAAAAGVPGVVEVTNLLFVHKERWRPHKEDEAIEEDIEDQLFWSPYVDADSISVSVEDGVATLAGTVGSFSERLTAIENAHQGGAREVRNRLSVNGAKRD